MAYSYALSNLKSGDEIVVSVMEHHSNLLPWQMAAKKTGAKLVFLEPDEKGRIPEGEFEKINEKRMSNEEKISYYQEKIRELRKK